MMIVKLFMTFQSTCKHLPHVIMDIAISRSKMDEGQPRFFSAFLVVPHLKELPN